MRNLCFLIVSIAVYMIWNKQNCRLHSNSLRIISTLSAIIRNIVSHKLKRWKLKDSWPDYVNSTLLEWRDFSFG